MQSKLMWLVLIGAAILASSGTALATPPEGFTSTTVAKGPFAAFDVTNYFVPSKGAPWISWMKTNRKSDGYVVSNDWQPGGTTGWHTHPGPTFVIVTAGTVTRYEADDPNCTPHVYSAGMTFVERGGSHVHIVRNEGSVEAQAILFRPVPSGQAPRIDAPDPGHCPF